MKLIVGLGNPGKRYERTRHNVGFLALDALLPPAQRWRASQPARAQYAKTALNDVPVELLKPSTYMNDSGAAVAYAVKKHGLSVNDVVVVHDDKDIPLGELRVQKNRGAAGHNGVASVIAALGSKNFWRIRIGVAPRTEPIPDTVGFVLGRLAPAELKILRGVFEQVRQEVARLLPR